MEFSEDKGYNSLDCVEGSVGYSGFKLIWSRVIFKADASGMFLVVADYSFGKRFCN